METFDELTRVWQGQKTPGAFADPEKIRRDADTQVRKVRQGHWATILILFITVSILVLLLSIQNDSRLALGLGLMVSALSIRVVLEYASVRRIGKLQRDQPLTTCRDEMERYYHWRVRLHRVYTPVLYAGYCVGFILMLPSFLQTMSPGLFTAVWVSGLFTLSGFALFMVYVLRKEIKVLKTIQNLFNDEHNRNS